MTAVLLTVPEAAATLRVHPETVRRMVRRGDLYAVKVGSAWRVPSAAVSAFTAPPPVRSPRRIRPDRETMAKVKARRRELNRAAS